MRGVNTQPFTRRSPHRLQLGRLAQKDRLPICLFAPTRIQLRSEDDFVILTLLGLNIERRCRTSIPQPERVLLFFAKGKRHRIGTRYSSKPHVSVIRRIDKIQS